MLHNYYGIKVTDKSYKTAIHETVKNKKININIHKHDKTE